MHLQTCRSSTLRASQQTIIQKVEALSTRTTWTHHPEGAAQRIALKCRCSVCVRSSAVVTDSVFRSTHEVGFSLPLHRASAAAELGLCRQMSWHHCPAQHSLQQHGHEEHRRAEFCR